MTQRTSGTAGQKPGREVFSSRTAFLFAAIGSAVGLGNIWRFPYTAYENGGGAFLIPYLVALLTAGIPLLFFDYAIGHRFRGSAPKSFRRLKSWAEPAGWVQVGVAFFITIYYSVIVAWALLYAFKSFGQSWGDDADSYFSGEFLRLDASTPFSLDFVWPIALALLLVWALVLGILAAGVDKGIGVVSKIFIPLLAVLFIIVVAFSLTLDGAIDGLDAFFTPNWEALGNPSVWIAAYGQIFFSLSVAFGIMLTYASYLKPRSNLTGTGLVTAFSNSSFEVLAGVGVFSTLGYMALQSGKDVTEVASGGIGLAFVAFPTVISQMGGVLGGIFGFLFFLSLFIAGITSLMSLLEVVVGACQDKFSMTRTQAVLIIGGVMAIIAMVLFPTTTGLVTLDIMDKFTNNIGIVAVAIIAIVVVDWCLHRTEELALHLNAVSSFKVANIWRICVANITPVVLAVMLFQEIATLVSEPYEGYSTTTIAIFGWGVLAVIFIGSMVMTIVPWRGGQFLAGPPGSDFGVRTDRQLRHRPPKVAVSDAGADPGADSHASAGGSVGASAGASAGDHASPSSPADERADDRSAAAPTPSTADDVKEDGR